VVKGDDLEAAAARQAQQHFFIKMMIQPAG
jgi:hypothetical protein